MFKAVTFGRNVGDYNLRAQAQLKDRAREWVNENYPDLEGEAWERKVEQTIDELAELDADETEKDASSDEKLVLLERFASTPQNGRYPTDAECDAYESTLCSDRKKRMR